MAIESIQSLDVTRLGLGGLKPPQITPQTPPPPNADGIS